MRFKWTKSIIVAISVFTSLYPVFADAYTEAKEKYDDLAKQVKEKESEANKLRKENPACLLKPETKSILNLEVKLPTREQKRYFFKKVTYVRSHFYCTKCKGEHDSSACATSRKMSWPRWREHYEKIEETIKYNKMIDTLMTELDALKKQLDEAQKEKATAWLERKRAKNTKQHETK